MAFTHNSSLYARSGIDPHAFGPCAVWHALIRLQPTSVWYKPTRLQPSRYMAMPHVSSFTLACSHAPTVAEMYGVDTQQQLVRAP